SLAFQSPAPRPEPQCGPCDCEGTAAADRRPWRSPLRERHRRAWVRPPPAPPARRRGPSAAASGPGRRAAALWSAPSRRRTSALLRREQPPPARLSPVVGLDLDAVRDVGVELV